MRLVILSAAYPSPAEPQRAIFIENLTRALGVELAVVRGGLRVVAPSVHATDPLEEDRGGVDVVRFRYGAGGRRLKELADPSLFMLARWVIASAFATWRAVRRVRPRVLLAHWVLPCGPVAALVALLARLPLVLVAHGSDVHIYGASSSLRRRLSRWALARSRRVVAVSAALEHALEAEFGVPPHKIIRLPMGVDDVWFARGRPEARAEARRALGVDGEERLLLFVGDVTPEKGVGDLLEAASRLVDLPAWRLVFAGDGVLRRDTVTTAGDRMDSHVRFVGRIAPSRLALWYRAADLLVLPSHGEGTPVSVLEALATGLPVVASRVGGIPEVVTDGRVGRLVPARDPDALAGVLRELLTSSGALASLRAAAASVRVPSARDQGARLARLLEEVSRDG